MDVQGNSRGPDRRTGIQAWISTVTRLGRSRMPHTLSGLLKYHGFGSSHVNTLLRQNNRKLVGGKYLVTEYSGTKPRDT